MPLKDLKTLADPNTRRGVRLCVALCYLKDCTEHLLGTSRQLFVLGRSVAVATAPKPVAIKGL
jgi:hypothetical protein